MRTLQRETGRAVVKLSIRPQQGVVAAGAKRDRETRRDVIGDVTAVARRVVPVFQVALGIPAIGGRESGSVVIADMAVRAEIDFARGRELVRTRQGEPRSGVIERGGQERDRVMAVGAIRRGKGSACCRVRGIVRSLPATAVVGIQMALRVAAVRRLDRQRRVVPDVTLIATGDFACRRNLVRIGQRESRVRMVESRIRPQNGVVALATQRRREARGDVIGHASAKRRRAVPRGLMATVAIRIRGSERVVVIDVAVRAGVHLARRRHLVRTHERPAGRSVIERDVCPQRRGVTRRAIGCRERRARRRVRGVVGLLPGGQVATGIPAIIWLDGQIVVVVDVAVGASVDFARWSQLVRIGQREPGSSVIKGRRQPGDRGVTIGAGSHRENIGRRGVLGICGVLPGGQVALRISAVRRCYLQTVVPAKMAIHAGNVGVPVSQRKIDWGRGVVHRGSQPTVKGVARFAGLRELRGNVIWVGGLLEVGLVARNAGGRESLILADGSPFVTILALHGSVRAQERKAVLVIPELLDRDVPALDGMTLGAVGAHFALVDVAMAVFAILSHIGENRLYVALRALHFFVHAAQRILGFVVVKFGVGANGPPSGGRVAILAGDGESPVRTSGGLPLRRLRWSVGWRPPKKKQPAQNMEDRVRSYPLNYPRSVFVGRGVQQTATTIVSCS